MINPMPAGRSRGAFTLAELFAMLQLNAHVLCQFVTQLTIYEVGAHKLGQEGSGNVTPQNKLEIQPMLDVCGQVTQFFFIPATDARLGRLKGALEADCEYSELNAQLRALRETLEDELRSLFVLYMPPKQATSFLAGSALLGAKVESKFPALATDIEEAGKCLGTGRTTAAVFHLMRVMETGVQELAGSLGVAVPQEKMWQPLLDEIDKAIRGLPLKDAKTAQYAEASANLFNVKLAWRNEVMHPKRRTRRKKPRACSTPRAHLWMI